MQVCTAEDSGIIERGVGRANGKTKISNTLYTERQRCEDSGSTRRLFRRRGEITENHVSDAVENHVRVVSRLKRKTRQCNRNEAEALAEYASLHEAPAD